MSSASPRSISAESLTSISSIETTSRSSETCWPLSEDLSSDDEIVWTLASDGEESSSGVSSGALLGSDEDYVLLSRSTSRLQHRPTSTDNLSDIFSHLAVSTASDGVALPSISCGHPMWSSVAAKRGCQKKYRKSKAKHAATSKVPAHSYPSPAPSPSLDVPPSSTAVKKPVVFKPTNAGTKKASKKRKVNVGHGQHQIIKTTQTDAAYEQAAKYITSFLSNPKAKEQGEKLTFLRALIIELGLCTSASACASVVPRSIKAAQTLLKSRAFINIGEYIAVRGKGQTALQQIMQPNRTALIKSIRKDKNRPSLKRIKAMGLNVFLVSCYH